MAEMETAQRENQSRLTQTRQECIDRALPLRSIADKVAGGQDLTFADLDQLQDAVAANEQMIESLSIYELMMSPPMAAFFDVLQNEQKPIYIRSSPLLPYQVELSLMTRLRMNRTAKMLTVFAVPEIAELRLPELLSAYVEKIDPNAETVAPSSASVSASGSGSNLIVSNRVLDTIDGHVTVMPNRNDGAAQAQFVLEDLERRDGSGVYLVHVRIYGRPVKNSPMKIRVCSVTDVVQVRVQFFGCVSDRLG